MSSDSVSFAGIGTKTGSIFWMGHVVEESRILPFPAWGREARVSS